MSHTASCSSGLIRQPISSLANSKMGQLVSDICQVMYLSLAYDSFEHVSFLPADHFWRVCVAYSTDGDHEPMIDFACLYKRGPKSLYDVCSKSIVVCVTGVVDRIHQLHGGHKPDNGSEGQSEWACSGCVSKTHTYDDTPSHSVPIIYRYRVSTDGSGRSQTWTMPRNALECCDLLRGGNRRESES